MDKKDLIQKYLEAETSVTEERELAKADKNVGLLAEALAAEPLCQLADTAGGFAPLPDVDREFDRIVRRARIRTVRRWSYVISGAAAILVAVLFLTRKPATPLPAQQDAMEMIQQLQLISSLDPADADNYEFKPVGDGYIMTAYYADGSTASFLLAPMDGGESFHLVALKH